MKNFITTNRTVITGVIAFVGGGLTALGYTIPQPVINLLYSVLGLN